MGDIKNRPGRYQAKARGKTIKKAVVGMEEPFWYPEKRSLKWLNDNFEKCLLASALFATPLLTVPLQRIPQTVPDAKTVASRRWRTRQRKKELEMAWFRYKGARHRSEIQPNHQADTGEKDCSGRAG